MLTSPRELILAVGFGPARLSAINVMSPILSVGFDDISKDLIRRLRPALVLSPLVSGRFDCVELGQRLKECGYTGDYLIVMRDEGALDMIRHELNDQFGGLQHEVIRVDDIELALREAVPAIAG